MATAKRSKFWLAADGWQLGLADVAQLVEHSLGKGEVTSSILVIGSRDLKLRKQMLGTVWARLRMSWDLGGFSR